MLHWPGRLLRQIFVGILLFWLYLHCKNVVASSKLFGNLVDKSRVNIENITRSVSSEGDNNSSMRVWIIEVLNRVSLSNYGKNNLHLYCNCIFKFFFRTLPTKNQGMVNSRPNQTSGQGKNQWLAHWIFICKFSELFLLLSGAPFKCNSPLVVDQDSGQCRPPCDWTTQSSLTQKLNYGIVVTGFWLILIATIITFVTWYSIKNL